MKTILILCTTFLLTACACTKNSKPILNERLPPATQTGENTFGCTLNGQVFIPNLCNCTVMSETALDVYGYYINTDNYSRRIFAKRGRNFKNLLYISVYLYQLDIKKEDEYILGKSIIDLNTYDQPFNNYIQCLAISPTTSKRKIYGSYENSGKIIVTRWDKQNMILSGTFSGKLKEIDGEEIIEIENGRFDINSKTLK